MGTGCTGTKVGTCAPSDRLSSNCVIWQGDAYERFGICTGDTITEVTEVVLYKLIEFAEGEGIHLAHLTAGCTELEDKLRRTDYSLFQIVDLLFKENCRLDEAVTRLGATIDSASRITIDTSCLTTTPIRTREELDRAFLEAICTNTERLDALTSGLSAPSGGSDSSGDLLSTIREEIGNFLLAKLGSHNGVVEKTGSGSAANINIIGVPMRGTVFGDFDLTKFDSTGKGTGIYTNFALANGNNGTIDMRGYVPSMATTISGVARTFSISQSPNSIAGNDTTTLSSANLPNHTHTTTVTQEPHRHVKYEGVLPTFGYAQNVSFSTGGAKPLAFRSEIGHSADHQEFTSEETVPITVTVSGVTGATNQPIDNRQPTRYGVWIQRIK